MKRSLKDILEQPQNEDQEKRIEEAFDSYKDLSQQELMAKLIENVKSQKQSGSFNESMFDNLIKNSSGMLNNDQIDKMKSLVDQLKKI